MSSAWDEQGVVLFSDALTDQLEGSGYRITVAVLTRGLERDPRAARMAALAESAQVPVVTVDAREVRAQHDDRPEWRQHFEEQILRHLADYAFDAVFLCGYMWIAADEMIRSLRMINLHPALPGGPTGSRPEVVTAVVRERLPAMGLILHAVTAELDKGPALTVFETATPQSVRSWQSDADMEMAKTEVESLLLRAERPFVKESLRTLGASRLPDRWPPKDSPDWPREVTVTLAREDTVS